MIAEPALSSGSLAVTTAVAVIATPALLHSLIFNPGSAVSTVIVYDNASAASGTVLASLVAAANGASIPVTFSTPVTCLKGITVAVTGTAATAVLSFTKAY